ncbi:response regulator transcription factor [Aggregicoccus sp. 17bor-14]|uniref:response regulator transcription factor n=1 Tax=Myxococcaceae TaxID=31 RepID=UPI00129C7903|nr:MULTISPECIES: response regulator transcription factor [Myxococcaceae]MBF5042377.1 response regulator transcription factor [Simulacricoccus sp. 17bor-14]MRI88150.1 response regulator transcription factor [Aggregicoccus sp. 17bor-14]
MPSTLIRVALLEPQALVRELLVMRLRAAGMQVAVAEAHPERLDVALAHAPADVALLCVRAAPGSVELIRGLQARHPRMRLLVVAPDPEPVFIESAWAAGARGVLCRRNHGPAELLRALRTLARGEARLGSELPHVPPIVAARGAMGLLPN